jgi:bifunctional oligoribonuclease and PAP phosphatase NrnA
MVFTNTKINQVKTVLENVQTIVITAHRSPDGDSIGSSLALYHYLRSKNYSVKVCMPDPCPYFLNWLSGSNEILNTEENYNQVRDAIDEADLVFCLDFNDLSRVGKTMNEFLIASSSYKVMIDHHLHPSEEFDLVFSDVSACSTAQLIYDFVVALGDEKILPLESGYGIYCGIMTDTGSFRFPSMAARTHEILAALMRLGVKHYEIHENIYDTNTLDRLKLRGYAINEKLELIEPQQTTIISLTKEEMERYNYRKGDTEGLVNVGLSIEGITRSIYLQEGEGLIKMSFRSKGIDNPVNQIASRYFHGGGHANASGGKFEGSMEDAIRELKRVIHENW